MKYITSCPQCDTQFLIDDELIEAYQGDVQCGNCEHVFNTQDRLTGVSDDIHSAEEYQASLEGQQHDDAETIVYAPEPEIHLDEKPSTNTAVESTVPSFIDGLTSDERRTKKKRSHGFLYGLLALLLLSAAALQAIHHYRVKIAAEYPQFKPYLVEACIHLRCEVRLPQNLDYISIGSSDMQEDDTYESVINFTSTFKNKANYAQQYPNIELTLTNERDQVVIRRLVSPSDYLPADTDIEAGMPAQGVTNIKLPLFVHQAVVAGYRMLLVY